MKLEYHIILSYVPPKNRFKTMSKVDKNFRFIVSSSYIMIDETKNINEIFDNFMIITFKPNNKEYELKMLIKEALFNVRSCKTRILKFESFKTYEKNKWFHEIVRVFSRIDD